MSNERLSAQVETRIFYFHTIPSEPNEIAISMYNTVYRFIKKEDKWVNSATNQMTMAQYLIDAVVASIREKKK